MTTTGFSVTRAEYDAAMAPLLELFGLTPDRTLSVRLSDSSAYAETLDGTVMVLVSEPRAGS